MKLRAFPLLVLLALPLAAADVLMIVDEVPAMEVLAGHLKRDAGAACTIVKQPEMPPDLARYGAVFVYIHGAITEPVAKAAIDYAKNGGKLILLHHSISSGKRKNSVWLPFLGVELPTGDFSQGGYRWTEGINLEFVNLAPSSEITTRGVQYPEKVEYKGAQRPGFELEDSEVYLNHRLSGPRTVLLGLKYRDAKTGETYMQDTAGWYMRAGKGWVMYFMGGHSVREFQNPVYARILVNAYQAQLRP